MLARYKKIFLVVLVTCLPACTFAQATFTATITPSVIGKDETAQLSFTVNNAQQVEQIEPPVLKNFDVVGGPEQQSSFQSINGVTKQSIGVSYIIKPKATGNFIIDEASAKADGKILKSNKVTLKVVKAPQGNNNNQQQNLTSISPFSNMPGFDEPARTAGFDDEILKEGENVQKKIDKNIFIKAIADKNSCYVGEPIVVTYKLYTRLKAESNITKSPSFNGFSVIDMSQADNNSGAIEKIDGREYNTYTLLKMQLYPLQPGKFDLDPTETDNTIYFIKEAYAKQQGANVNDMLNNFAASNIPAEAVATEHVTLQSKPLTITVKDLPKNKPASFKGAVGDFTITATPEKNRLTTDDDGKLAVVITGNGNMTLLNAPDITWPAGIDGFEPKTTESLNKLTVPVSGSKIFEYQFNASKAGDYTLPAIEFSYFDAKSGDYKTISTQPIPLTISQGVGKNYDLKNSTLNSTEKKNSTTTPNGLVFGILAIVISTALFFYTKRGDKKLQKAKLSENKISTEKIAIATKMMVAVKPLALTEVMLAANNSKEFYDTLNKELKTFLATRFNINPEEINKKRIAEEMDKHGIALTTNLKVMQLLDDIEWQLYTPFAGHNEMQEIYERANTIIHSI